MQHLFQSPFLQALGYAITNSLWQTALIWLIYTSVSGLVPMNAAIKYRLAVFSQLTGFIWFVFTFRFYYQPSNTGWLQNSLQHGSDRLAPVADGGGTISSAIIHWLVKGEQLLPYVSMAYLLLIIFLVIRWVAGFRQTQKIRYSGLQKMPVSYRLFVQRIASQLGIRQKISLFLSDTVSSPLTIGFLKPVILVPIASINHLSTDQLEAVLLHELAHIKRYDYLVNILISVVEISLFFNPFTQLISKSIRKERENSCDDWVLQFKYNASVYAEALLRIAYLQATPAFAMAATGKKNELLVRVKRMIEQKENRFNYRRQLLAFVIVTGILSSIAWLSPITTHQEAPVAQTGTLVSKNNPLVNNQQSPTVAAEPKTAKEGNPIFNPMFLLPEPVKAEISKSLASTQKELAQNIGKQVTEAVPQLVSSLTPLVTNALEKAAHSVGSVAIPAINSAIDELKNTKLDFGVSLKDSLQALPAIHINLEEEINQSFKKAADEIRKASKEMNRVTERSKNNSQKANKEIAELDLQKAVFILQQLDRIGFDQMMHDMVTVPATFFETPAVPFQKLQTAFHYHMVNNKRNDRQKQENGIAENEPADQLVNATITEEMPDEAIVQLPETIAYSTPMAAMVKKIKLDPASFLKLVYLKKAALEKLRVLRLDSHEKQDDGTRIIIQMQ